MAPNPIILRYRFGNFVHSFTSVSQRHRMIRNMTACCRYLQLCATLGTTGACAFDKLSELGPICE